MDRLDEYLQGEFLDDKVLIGRLGQDCVELVRTFSQFFDWETEQWPYQLVNGSPIDGPVEYSFSTNAMVLFALLAAMGAIRASSLVPALSRTVRVEVAEDLGPLIARATSSLVTRSQAQEEEHPQSVTQSTTFGDDDPFTLTWLLEALTAIQSLGLDLVPTKGLDVKSFTERTVKYAIRRVQAAFREPQTLVLAARERRELVPHAFPALRNVQLAATLRSMGSDPNVDYEVMRQFFMDRLYSHLAKNQIPDSEFDATEMAFSLEGALLCDDQSIDPQLLKKTFQILSETQERTPYWRPLRPFLANAQGLILLAQSVEAANSLLRICNQLDRQEFGLGTFSGNHALFTRYTGWLRSRRVCGRTTDGRAFAGWQSDHTHVPGRIHLWASSQVLLFMQHYRAMLQQHVARASLIAGGFTRSLPSILESSDQRKEWDAWEMNEPLLGMEPSPYATLKLIGDRFVRPRLATLTNDQPDAGFSMLLHGPPGTGKTTLAEKLAKTLQRELITITPSDFISSGEAGVEARAKVIFTTLTEQADVVILFDEIDRLILDRESILGRVLGGVRRSRRSPVGGRPQPRLDAERRRVRQPRVARSSGATSPRRSRTPRSWPRPAGPGNPGPT